MPSRWMGWILALVIGLSGCAPQAAGRPANASEVETSKPLTLTVMAAGSLTESFGELGRQFEREHGDVTVQFSFAGSQQLAQQLAGGAPADVFASANQKQMDAVVAAGRVEQSAPRIFARNKLVVIVPAANPGGINTLNDLSKAGLKLVLAAKEVPVGQYSLDFLDRAAKDPNFSPGYKDAVLANVVSYEENVKSVLAKVALGEADAGIVYSTDIAGEVSSQVARIDIPDSLNVIASYPVAVIQDSTHPEIAQAFLDLLFSTQGQAVLAKYGFIPPEP